MIDFFSVETATSNKTMDGIDWKLLYEVAHEQEYLIRSIIQLKINTQKTLHEIIKYNGLDASSTGVEGYLTPQNIQGRFAYNKGIGDKQNEIIKLMAEKWEDIVKYLFLLEKKIKTGRSNKTDNQPDLFGET